VKFVVCEAAGFTTAADAAANPIANADLRSTFFITFLLFVWKPIHALQVVRADVSAATRHRYLEVLIVLADGTGAAAEKRNFGTSQVSSSQIILQRGSAGGQMQKLSPGKFHGIP